MKKNLGYCCINISLQSKKITCNRGMVKKTFKSKGLPYASELSLKNVKDLVEIIKWNEQNDIKVYRMSSDLFPWSSEYELTDLPDYQKIKTILLGVGNLVQKYGTRISFHPGPFNVLGSPNPVLVKKTQKELNQHAEIMDLMGLPQSHQYPINIHCNGTYGSKVDTLTRWSENFKELSESARKRLVVENDDKASMYSVADLFDGIFQKVKVPITFDYHHHRFNDGGLSEEAAFRLAASTWHANNVTPLFHYSSCRKTFEDPLCKAQAHADYIYEKINNYDLRVDIEVEAKAKDLAILRYRETENTLLENYVTF
jgi:UV DNA damage endonuclease